MRDVAGLTADLKTAMEVEYAKTGTGDQGSFAAISAAMANAIDAYIAQIVTSVEAETLV